MPKTASPRNTSSDRSRGRLRGAHGEHGEIGSAAAGGTAEDKLAPFAHTRRRNLTSPRWYGVLLCATAVICTPGAGANDQARPVYEPLEVGPHERLLVIAPHPDDEALGAGGLTQRVLARGGIVHTAVVTAGDGYVEAVQQSSRQQQPPPWEFLRYGERRLREAQSSAHVLGAGRIRLHLLGFPDGGISPLLAAHWEHRHPERSTTTRRDTPPYTETAARGATYSGHDLRGRVLALLHAVRPTMVAFTDPLDQHPDHRAVGLFALLAISDFMRARRGLWPRLLAFVVHYNQWPFDPDGRTESRRQPDPKLGFPQDFPQRDQTRSCLKLSDAELAAKQAALSEYRTQQAVMAPFLAGFLRRSECFSLNTELDATLAGREVGRFRAKPPAR